MNWKVLRELFYRPKKREADDLLKLASRYRDIFSSPQGEEVLLHICREGFVFGTTFVANDPYQTALNEGSRRLALGIVRMVERDLKQLQITNETTES